MIMRFQGGLKKALTLSYDDGAKQDVRLVEIMAKHGLKGTFNVNSCHFENPADNRLRGFCIFSLSL